jgi:flagellar hook-length control protein FliK
MTDLPISISNAPAKNTADKQPSGNIEAQQDTQEFGNMLARQVNNSAKSDTPANQRPGRDTSKKTAEQSNSEPVLPPGDINALPADMLAALMVQQNQQPFYAPPEALNNQTEIPPQATATAPLAANLAGVPNPNGMMPPASFSGDALPGSPQPETLAALPMSAALPASAATFSNMQDVATPAAPGLQETGTAMTPGVANNIARIPQPMTDTVPTKFEVSANTGKGLAVAAKISGVKELDQINTSQPARSAGSTELLQTAQQASILPILQGTTASSSPHAIHTPLTQPAWGEEFSQKITWMAGQRNQSAELHLNPPHLGPLDVVLKMNGDQASAIFTSPHAAVRNAIEQALPQLREMLADSGIMLGNASVNDQAAHKNQDNSARKSSAAKSESTSEIVTNANLLTPVQSRHNGMVDTFA